MTHRSLPLVAIGAALLGLAAGRAASPGGTQNEPVAIRVDTLVTRGPMYPFWAWFGHDEPNYTYTPNGMKLLSQLQGDGRRAGDAALVPQHTSAGTNYATGKTGTPLDLITFHAKGSPAFVNLEGGRVLRGMRRQPLPPERLSERHDVPDLHGAADRTHLRTGGPAEGEPDRRRQLGVPVRGPAVLRRLPRSGDQRHREAGTEHLPDAGTDERQSRGGREFGRPACRRDSRQRRPTPSQYAELEKASEMQKLTPARQITIAPDGRVGVAFDLPRKSVSFIKVIW